MRLDQLYKESKLLCEEIKKLDEKCLKETDITLLNINHDTRSRKLIDLERTSRYIFFAL